MKPLTQEEKDTVSANLGLVSKAIEKYYTNKWPAFHLQLDDARQVCAFAMLKAARYYNKEKGAFSTYAMFCMKQDLFKHARKTLIIRPNPKVTKDQPDKKAKALPAPVAKITKKVAERMYKEDNGQYYLEVEDAARYALSILSDKEKEIFLPTKNTKQLAREDGTSAPVIRRKRRIIRRKLQEALT